HQHHQTIAANSTGSEIPVEEDPENFVPVANADSPANATGGSAPSIASSRPSRRSGCRRPWIPIDHTSGLTMYLHKPTKGGHAGQAFIPTATWSTLSCLCRRTLLSRLSRSRSRQQQPAQDGIESGKEQLEVPNAAVAEDSPAAPLLRRPAEDSDARKANHFVGGR
uniref:Uncharacterized protein n=1 Tax=Macrostomum lignano TaxID=282301 RepID=A0A1I8F3X5_9PLAT